MADAELHQLLGESCREELATSWLAEHLAAVPAGSDAEAVRGVHGRGLSCLEALAAAISAGNPGEWGSFAHREAVQILTLMACSLAETGASPVAAGVLVPALGRALEKQGARSPSSILVPLSGVAVEAFNATCISMAEREGLKRLVRTTPVVKLRQDLVLVAATGTPDGDSATAVVERALRVILKLRTETPVVVLDLSHLEDESRAALVAFLGLPADVAGLGGVCYVAGLTAARRDLACEVGVDLDGVTVWTSLEEGFAKLLPEGLLRRLGRVLR